MELLVQLCIYVKTMQAPFTGMMMHAQDFVRSTNCKLKKGGMNMGSSLLIMVCMLFPKATVYGMTFIETEGNFIMITLKFLGHLIVQGLMEQFYLARHHWRL